MGWVYKSIWLDCHSSEIPTLETGVAAKVLDGGGALEALSGWKREGIAFCEWFAFAVNGSVFAHVDSKI